MIQEVKLQFWARLVPDLFPGETIEERARFLCESMAPFLEGRAVETYKKWLYDRTGEDRPVEDFRLVKSDEI